MFSLGVCLSDYSFSNKFRENIEIDSLSSLHYIGSMNRWLVNRLIRLILSTKYCGGGVYIEAMIKLWFDKTVCTLKRFRRKMLGYSHNTFKAKMQIINLNYVQIRQFIVILSLISLHIIKANRFSWNFIFISSNKFSASTKVHSSVMQMTGYGPQIHSSSCHVASFHNEEIMRSFHALCY